MKLKKALKIIKTRNFHVYVYPHGHVKEQRGLCESRLDYFSFGRKHDGSIPFREDIEKYKDLSVVEIVQYSNAIGIVVELDK